MSMLDERKIYPDFPRRFGFVEAELEQKATQTRQVLSEFGFAEDERYQAMRAFVGRHIEQTFAEAGLIVKETDLFQTYLIKKERLDELKRKTGFASLGKSHQIGNAIHVLVDDNDMLSNTFILLEESLHSIGTSRLIIGRQGIGGAVNQAGLMTVTGKNFEFGVVLEEGEAGYESLVTLKKATAGELLALGIPQSDIDLINSLDILQLHDLIAKRIHLRPIYHSAVTLVDKLVEADPYLRLHLLRARMSDEGRGGLIRQIDKAFRPGVAKKIMALNFDTGKAKIDELAKNLNLGG